MKNLPTGRTIEAIPDSGLLRLVGGGEPSLATFTTPTTFTIATGDFNIGADAEKWVLNDGAIASVTYIGTSPAFYLFTASVPLESAVTVSDELTSAGVDHNGDLSAQTCDSAQAINSGSQPVFIQIGAPGWAFSCRLLQVSNGSLVSLSLATADGTTRTSRGPILSWVRAIA